MTHLKLLYNVTRTTGSHKTAFERLERSAVKVARSVPRRGCGSNVASLSDNVDAWDGYDAERARLLDGIEAVGARDVVVLTGDLHAATVSTVKKDFLSENVPLETNLVAKEFMTPALTSASFMEIIARQLLNTPGEDFIRELLSSLTRANNPHIQFFDPTISGYSIAEFTAEKLTWRTYVVNKNSQALASSPELLVQFETSRGEMGLRQV